MKCEQEFYDELSRFSVVAWAEAVLNWGVYLCTRDHHGNDVQLYALQNCFAEVYFDPHKNEVWTIQIKSQAHVFEDYEFHPVINENGFSLKITYKKST